MPGLPTITAYALPTRDTLPEHVADWTVRPERAVLLIHDMQEYFLRPLPEALRTDLIYNTALVRKRAAGLGVPVA